jgi:hypothetical protein
MFSRGGPQASILSQRGNSRGASSLRGRITGGNVLSAGGCGGIGGNSINQSSINNSDECNSMPNIAPGQTPQNFSSNQGSSLNKSVKENPENIPIGPNVGSTHITSAPFTAPI